MLKTAFLLIFHILFLFSSAHAKENVSLQLIWKHQFQFAGYYMAKEKGYYADADLNVTIKEFGSNVNVTNDVMDAKVDFGVGRSSLINDKLNGEEIVMLSAIFQHSPVILLSKKRDDLQSVSDLKDKNIMMTNDQVDLASINAMLLSYGVRTGMYQYQPHTFNVQDLIDNKTDAMVAYTSNEPFQLKEKGVKYTMFSPREDGFDFYSDILFTSEKLITKNPKMIKNFTEASLKGWQYAIDNPEEAISLILKKYNTQHKTRKALAFEAKEMILLIDDNIPLGDIQYEKIEKIAQLYRLMGLAKGNGSLDNILYDHTEQVILHNNFNINLFLNKIIPAVSKKLYDIDTDDLPLILRALLKENSSVQAVEIKESIDNERVFSYFRNNNKLEFNKEIPKRYLKNRKRTKSINYSGESVGRIIVYYVDNQVRVTLTKEEKAWIKAHPIIHVGGEMDWAPFDFVNDEGNYDGLANDYLLAIQALSGLKFKVHTGQTWNELLEDFKAKKLDLLPALYHSKEREQFTHFTTPYVRLPDYIFTKDTYKQLESIGDLNDKTIVVVKGYEIGDWLKSNHPKIKLLYVDNIFNALRDVMSGKADAFIGDNPSTNYVIKTNILENIKINLVVTERSPTSIHMGVRKDYTLLFNIINKSIGKIPSLQREKIKARWFSFLDEKKLKLTQAEQDWIEKKIPIKYVYDSSWEPFEWKNELNRHAGILADVLKLVERRSGIKLKEEESEKWSEAIAKIEDGRAGMYSGLGETKERRETLYFTKNKIFSTPYVFISLEGNEFPRLFDSLKGKKLSVIKTYTIEQLLKADKPDFKFGVVENTIQGFEDVRSGKIDVFLVNAATAMYFTKYKGYDDLKISKTTKYFLDLKIAIRNDYPPEVISILDKALATITDDEFSTIYERWLYRKVNKTIGELIRENKEYIALGFGIILFIIFFMLWNNRKLTSKVKDKTKEISLLLEEFDKNIIASKTDTKGVITYVSDAFVDICEYSREELIGKPHNIVRHPDVAKEEFTDMWKTIKSGETWRGEVKNLKKGGHFYWVDAIISSEYDKDENLKGYSAIEHDITAQKEVEDLTANLEVKIEERTKELEKERTKAQEATKSKSEFLANMSHEIRTPMNGIIGMTHLALQTELNDKQKSYLQKVDNSAKALLGIINDILDFSKIEAGKLTIEKIDFDMYKVIDNVVQLVENQVEIKNLELIVSYAQDVGKNYFGDSLRISQIITNLLSNAVKFTSEGEIGIYISKASDDRFRFEIKDSGIGLTPEQVGKLFKSFSQADSSTTRKYGGTGLGLTICKQLTELMGGKIWVESEAGVGSSFIFEIELEEKEDEKTYNIFGDKKILVVDDNESWHTILTSTLESFGIDVEHAYDGNEAVEKVAACSDYDLILMDWNMPNLDGIEATRKIQENASLKKIPTVVMISAYNEDVIIQSAKEVGIDIFLQKPINPSILNDILSGIFLDDVSIQHSLSETNKSLKDDMQTLAGSYILLTEDNETNQDIIIGLLEDSGIHIDIANDGQEAVDKYSTNPSKYELIFMDLQMPVMDGYGATKLIREMNKEIPIIALTANAMLEDIERTQSVGMNEHLNKPIEVEKLYATLLKYLSKKQDLGNSDEKAVEEEITLPSFKTLNSEIALDYLSGNKKLYLSLLADFYKRYKSKDFTTMQDDEFARSTHTLKGLSASLGAQDLNVMVSELDKTQDRDLLPEFNVELTRVLDELEKTLVKEERSSSNEEKEELSQEKKDAFVMQLKEALESMEPEECGNIINEFSKYNLSDEDTEVFDKITHLIAEYDFDEALELLQR